jgi:hypothetical protein
LDGIPAYVQLAMLMTQAFDAGLAADVLERRENEEQQD